MTTLRTLIIVIVLGTALTACRDSAADTVAVPRRTAYPRICIPAAIYTPFTGAPLHFETSAAATAGIATPPSGHSAPGSTWVDVVYPGYGITIHCTFTQADADRIPGILDNRIERLSINTGGATSEVSELTNAGGFDCRMIVTRAESPTPVQFLASDHERWVVSGSAYIEAGRNASPDSIAPVISMLERDITHSLTTLKR